MSGFSFRDYVVSALIIVSVSAGWFFIMAALLGVIDPQISLPLAALLGYIAYRVIKRKKPKKS
jgi:hypothetical protein